MKKILISGFEPFAGNQSNPTQDLALSLPNNDFLQSIVLPVSFQRGWNTLEEKIISMKPQWVISFGVAAKRQTIDFERVALNFMDASIPDNDGLLMKETFIDSQFPSCFINELPLNDWTTNLSNEFPVNVSLSAGSFVCNHLYFNLLKNKDFYNYQTIFIHLPYAQGAITQETFQKFLVNFLLILNQNS